MRPFRGPLVHLNLRVTLLLCEPPGLPPLPKINFPPASVTNSIADCNE